MESSHGEIQRIRWLIANETEASREEAQETRKQLLADGWEQIKGPPEEEGYRSMYFRRNL